MNSLREQVRPYPGSSPRRCRSGGTVSRVSLEPPIQWLKGHEANTFERGECRHVVVEGARSIPRLVSQPVGGRPISGSSAADPSRCRLPPEWTPIPLHHVAAVGS